MTKVRDPLTFALAITTITDLIGFKAAARTAKRAVRTVRHWGDSKNNGTPSLRQAIAMDRAFLDAGGGYAPILESYARQLGVAVVDRENLYAALAECIAAASREMGEAISHCIVALQPGASAADVRRAIAETEEADDTLPLLLGLLKSLLPGNGAEREAIGECR